MKAIEQYFHVVLFILLYNVVLILSLWLKPWRVTMQIKAIELCFHVHYAVQGGSTFLSLVSLVTIVACCSCE